MENKEEINELIEKIKKYDKTSVRNKYIVEYLRGKLRQISNDLVDVRIKWYKNVLHCDIIYAYAELSDILSTP